MLRSLAIALGLVTVLAAAYLRGCTGPRPRVTATALDPTPAGLLPRATVRNDGGPGQVEVEFRIRDLATGRTFSAEGRGQLERGEEIEIRSADPLPPGEYAIDAHGEYPPR